MEFIVIIFVIIGDISSLHILQYQGALVLTTVIREFGTIHVNFPMAAITVYKCLRIFFSPNEEVSYLVIHGVFFRVYKMATHQRILLG